MVSIWPLSALMSNDPASVPPSVYVNGSPSASVAVTGAPTASPGGVFSGKLRLSVGPAKIGALLFVRPLPGGDQSLCNSPLNARTRT